MPSRTISRHHWYIVRILAVRPNRRIKEELKWNHITKPDVRSKAERAPVKGQGLGLTI